MTKVVDTNVALVVKFPDEHPPALVDACEEFLEEVLTRRLTVVTDEGGEIVEEYFHQLSRSGGPSLGDAFARYVHDHRYGWDPELRPDIVPAAGLENIYRVLDGDDAEIDPSDRKFVAAAKVAGVPVVESTDTKWLDWGPVLARHGVVVEWIDERAIRIAYREKFGRKAPR
ncbi:MAG: hypothetical protein QM809_01285 [Gordonia sp. (in: high G+C Gram-positive bacteria)]|uniref:hypothetical protein n=1 Tax=Gordonia sp. (in: high G+C Gram-positive bacteria) TaxID=84139 RepID=UPI0039E65CEF